MLLKQDGRGAGYESLVEAGGGGEGAKHLSAEGLTLRLLLLLSRFSRVQLCATP